MPEPLSEARLAEIRATPCAWCRDDPFVPEGHRRGCPFGDLLAAYDAYDTLIADEMAESLLGVEPEIKAGRSGTAAVTAAIARLMVERDALRTENARMVTLLDTLRVLMECRQEHHIIAAIDGVLAPEPQPAPERGDG